MTSKAISDGGDGESIVYAGSLNGTASLDGPRPLTQAYSRPLPQAYSIIVAHKDVEKALDLSSGEEPGEEGEKDLKALGSVVWDDCDIKNTVPTHILVRNVVLVIFGSSVLAFPMLLLPLEYGNTGKSAVLYYASSSFLYYVLLACSCTLFTFVPYQHAHWGWKAATLILTVVFDLIWGGFVIKAIGWHKSHIAWCAVLVMVSTPWFLIPLLLTYLHRKEKSASGKTPLLSYQLWVWQSMWIFNIVACYFFCQAYASVVWKAVNPTSVGAQYGMLLGFSFCLVPFGWTQAIFSHGCELHTTAHYEFEMLGDFCMNMFFCAMECALFTSLRELDSFAIFCLSMFLKDLTLFLWGMSERRVKFLTENLPKYKGVCGKFLHDKFYMSAVHLKNSTSHTIWESWRHVCAPEHSHAHLRARDLSLHGHRLAGKLWPTHLQGRMRHVQEKLTQSEKSMRHWLEDEQKTQPVTAACLLTAARRMQVVQANIALVACFTVSVGYLCFTPFARFTYNWAYYADGSRAIDSDINRHSADDSDFQFGIHCELVGIAFVVGLFAVQAMAARTCFKCAHDEEHAIYLFSIPHFRNTCIVFSAHILSDLFFFLVDKKFLFEGAP